MDSSPWPGPLALIGVARMTTLTIHGFTSSDWGMIIGLLAMLVIAGLASASETALNSVNRISIRRLSEAGDQRAQLIARLIRDPNTYLTTILILNSVAVIISSTLATLLALDVFAAYGEVISTVLLALIVLIFCEIAPKSAAVQNPEWWARILAVPVYYIYIGLRPVIAIMTWLTSGLVRLFGGRAVQRGPFVTEEDLRMLVDVGEEEGVLEEDETDILHAVFGFSDKTVREIMIPRIDMVTIEADEPIDDGVGLILQGGQSRIPVYSESIDNIIGVLYAKDLLRALAIGNRPESVRSLIRPAYFVPETKHLDDLLHELQQRRVHMAIVNDEYGQVAGLATIEDLVEEILGDIQDEYDREETVYEKIGTNEYLVDAKIGIDDFNDLLDASLKSEDYDTLGGFVYAQLDKIPSVGDVVHEAGLTYTVLGTRGRRITKVKVVRGEENTTEPDTLSTQEARTAEDVSAEHSHAAQIANSDSHSDSPAQAESNYRVTPASEESVHVDIGHPGPAKSTAASLSTDPSDAAPAAGNSPEALSQSEQEPSTLQATARPTQSPNNAGLTQHQRLPVGRSMAGRHTLRTRHR